MLNRHEHPYAKEQFDLASKKNPYMAWPCKILKITDEAPEVKLFELEPITTEGKELLNYKPGQFAFWSLPGFGEAPFSYTSNPGNGNKTMQFCIRRVGRVTSAIFNLKEGEIVHVRGPNGNWFPLEKMKGKNLLFVMGGLGAAPLRSVLKQVLFERDKYKNICILHGARTPNDMLFKKEFFDLQKDPTISCFLTVDFDDTGTWKGDVGVVTTLFKYAQSLDMQDTYALICGPPIMYKFVIRELLKMKMPMEHIYMTLERRMKCGVGKCGHCAINELYACLHGPVFNFAEARLFKEMI